MMILKIIKEMSLEEFEKHSWSGGAATLKKLIELDKVDIVEQYLEDAYGDDPLTDTFINDFLWFERDLIEKIIGEKLF